MLGALHVRGTCGCRLLVTTALAVTGRVRNLGCLQLAFLVTVFEYTLWTWLGADYWPYNFAVMCTLA